jgi:hypothetical protein
MVEPKGMQLRKQYYIYLFIQMRLEDNSNLPHHHSLNRKAVMN